MPRLLIALISLIFAVGATATFAEPRITVKTSFYTVKGKTERQIMANMNRKGPKHGFWARSIAQTKYKVSWSAGWSYAERYCRVSQANVELGITYVYPSLDDGVPSRIRKRWKRFMAGVTDHEEFHGRLAREMAFDIEKAILSAKIGNDRQCRQMRSYLQRRVTRVIDDYEAQQKRYDRIEHRKNGRVDKLVLKFIE